jgi:hypothetical protein
VSDKFTHLVVWTGYKNGEVIPGKKYCRGNEEVSQCFTQVRTSYDVYSLEVKDLGVCES